MTLVRYNSQPVSSFSTLFDKFFENYANIESRVARFLPDVDFAESEKKYELHIALPGLDKKDVNIEVHNGTLTISGERKLVNENKEKTFKSIETRYGSFSRSFELPENIDSSKIEAEFKNGILEVHIPKDEKAVYKAKIEIK